MSKSIDQEREMFEREQRYVVFKLNKLSEGQISRLNEVLNVSHPEARALPTVDCLVIESDWPEHEPAWAMIEARMTGKQPAGGAVPEAMIKAAAVEMHRLGYGHHETHAESILISAAAPHPVSGEQTSSEPWHPEATQFAKGDNVQLLPSGRIGSVSGFNPGSGRYVVEIDVKPECIKRLEDKPEGNPCAEMEARLERLGIIPPLEPKP